MSGLAALTRRLSRPIFTPIRGWSWWMIVGPAAVMAFFAAAFVSHRLMQAEVMPDFREGYHCGALGIQNGEGYVNQNGGFITRWPPGASVFMSPWVVDDVIESKRRLAFASGVLAAVWVLLLALLFRRLLPRVSILAGLGLAVFWPPMLAMGDPARSEILFTVLITIALLLFVKLYELAPPSVFNTVSLTSAASLALAAGALTRTAGMAVAGATFIGIVLAFHSWSLRRRVFVASLGCLVFAAGLAPWVLTFRQRTGHYGVSSNGFRSVRDGLKGYTHFPLGVELQTRSDRWATYSDIWADLRDVAAADLGGTLHLVGIKIVRPWYATWSGRWDGLLLALQLPWLILFALASGRAVWRWRRIPGGILLLHGIVAAMWFTAFAVAPIFRYLSPAFPFVVLVVLWHTLDTVTPASVRGDAA